MLTRLKYFYVNRFDCRRDNDLEIEQIGVNSKLNSHHVSLIYTKSRLMSSIEIHAIRKLNHSAATETITKCKQQLRHVNNSLRFDSLSLEEPVSFKGILEDTAEG